MFPGLTFLVAGASMPTRHGLDNTTTVLQMKEVRDWEDIVVQGDII